MLTRFSFVLALSATLTGTVGLRACADWVTLPQKQVTSSAPARTVVTESSETLEDSASDADTSPQLDQEIAADVDRLLRQDENWMPPIVVDEDASDVEPVAHEDVSVSESLSYLDDLQQLNEDEHPWIASHVEPEQYDPTFGLARDFPSEAQLEVQTFVQAPAYMDDLQALVQLPDSGLIQNASQALVTQSDRNANYAPVPAPESNEEPSMDSLFAPLDQLGVSGRSSGDSTQKVASTKLPQSQAAEYFEGLIPAKYLAQPIVTVRRPNRYPHEFVHNPLYFEDPNLERCGKSCSYWTSAKSAGLFALQTAALPVTLCKTPPRSCMPTLGDCPTCHTFNSDAYFREWRK